MDNLEILYTPMYCGECCYFNLLRHNKNFGRCMLGVDIGTLFVGTGIPIIHRDDAYNCFHSKESSLDNPV